ncbi:MAG: magnesium transporter [Gammaproteobacteria bacterium SG8_47]|nr:MAG: magnesium transporter [Gammaproteobacteria bacterium SG8_47]
MEVPKSRELLQRHLEQVREALDKQRVLEHMVHAQAQPRQALVESLVHRQSLSELQKRLSRMHAADIAYVIDNLSPQERLLVWNQVPARRRGDVLLEVSDTVRAGLVEFMPHEALLSALAELDADDLSYLADDLPADVLNDALRAFPQADRDWVAASLHYDEDTVGALMSHVPITAREDQTLDAVLSQMRALQEHPAHLDKLFVLDRRGVFRGVLPVQQLLLRDPGLAVGEVVATDVVRFSPDDSADSAGQAFERYDLVSAPVLNDRGKIVGRLTVDAVMDYLRERSSDELLAMAGLSREEDLFASIWSGARNRWLWLSINLLTAFIASRVIGLFEDSIAQLVALAALMPIVASVGGNTGNQTTAIVIRAIAMGQHSTRTTIALARKEMGIALVNGMFLGLVVGAFSYAFYQDLALGGVLTSAMVLNLLLAAAVGLAVPLGLQRLGRDPALGSSVLLTAATDSMGFPIFLGLTTVVLL